MRATQQELTTLLGTDFLSTRGERCKCDYSNSCSCNGNIEQMQKANDGNYELPRFDLSKVRARVAKDHADWDTKRLDTALLRYRRFLQYVKMNFEAKHSPEEDTDEVWHTHILFTHDYMRDCNSYFGTYLHHVPTAREEVGACITDHMSHYPLHPDFGKL